MIKIKKKINQRIVIEYFLFLNNIPLYFKKFV